MEVSCKKIIRHEMRKTEGKVQTSQYIARICRAVLRRASENHQENQGPFGTIKSLKERRQISGRIPEIRRQERIPPKRLDRTYKTAYTETTRKKFRQLRNPFQKCHRH